MQDAKEEVRARLDIEDVVGEYVRLKRAGRSLKGLSPFKDEKTPSFVVSPEKQIWHDFSSGRGGDVFSFIMDIEGIDFKDALEMLARKAGVDLQKHKKAGDGRFAELKKRCYEANALAARYFQQSMVKDKASIDYIFKKRGFSKAVVGEFQLGYAPSSGQALTNALKKRGFSGKELSSAGLSNRFGSDLFRSRMMVPLMDTFGKIIGFTGRILEDDPKAPKYLNTPQTIIYDKSRHVFGFSQAKEAIRKNDYAVLVEGNLDVVSSHNVGIKQVVAAAGTALTEQHLKIISRLTKDIRLAFDGDSAGLAATERAIPLAQAVGVNLSIVSLPTSAKDPDELINQDKSLWQKAITEPKGAIDWLIEQYLEKEDVKTSSGKRNFSTIILKTVNTLADPVEREHYVKKVAELTDTSLGAIERKLQSEATGKSLEKKLKPVKNKPPEEKDDLSYQDNLLAVALLDMSVRDLIKTSNLEGLVGEERNKLAEYLSENELGVLDEVPDALQKMSVYVKIVQLKAENRYANWSGQDRLFEAADLIRQIKTQHKKKKQAELLLNLSEAEANGDEALVKKIRQEINQLIKEINSAKR